MNEKLDEYLERLLRCAGSSLRHYTPQSKEALRAEMQKVAVEIYAEAVTDINGEKK